MASDNPLGDFLRDRRGRLDPKTFGFTAGRRRTPGLRREEVAQRADISPTWYTWLEQGRGGAPSADVLDRIAEALLLTDLEREHLYLLGLGRTPEPTYRPVEGVSPRLQRVLDAMEICPALIRTAIWDVIAWNRAAAAVLTDYAALPPEGRNVLRLVFCDPRVRAAQGDWEGVARLLVSAFRADVTRIGAADRVRPFVEEMCRASPDFAAMWRDNAVGGHSGGIKYLSRPGVGSIALEFSAFAVDGRPDLAMMVFVPLEPADGERVRAAIRAVSNDAPG